MISPNGEFRFVFLSKDYATSVAFYRDDLALPIDHDWDYGPDDRGTVFKAGSALIEIFSAFPGLTYSSPQGIWMSIQVDNADEMFERAQQRGLKITQQPTNYPWGHRMFKILDPDGITVALYSTFDPSKTS